MPGTEKSFLLYAKNGTIGLIVDANLVIQSIQKGSMAEGKVFIGNKILRVNNQGMLTKAQFDKAVRDHAGQGITLAVWHDKEQVRLLQLDTPKSGFEIKEIWLVWNPLSQAKLGLAVKGEGNTVYITNVAENSVSSMYLQEGDRVLEIDGWPVVDKDMARTCLVNAFRYNNRVGLKIERAVIDEAKSNVSALLTAASNLEPSVIMQSDVLDIMDRQRDKIGRNEDNKIKCVYKSDGGAEPKKSDSLVTACEEKKRVQIKSQIDQKIIGRDNSEIVPLLRPVPSRNPNPNQGN
jgi:hypothetical protein